MCVVSHTTYGLTMTDGLWRAGCSCGWHGPPSADLSEQTDQLDQHLRVVVIAEQRPTRASRAATGTALHVVDHTSLLAGLVIALVLAVPALVRRT